MRDEDLYWLAGLLEGEGSFMKGPPSQPNRPKIAVQMTDLDVVERVRDLFGVGYIQTNKLRSERHKESYTVNVRGTKAIQLMKILQPFMGRRRKLQIQVALDSYNPNFRALTHRNNSHYTEEQIKEVKRLLRENRNHATIAKDLQVSQSLVKGISAGRIYKD